MTISSSKSYWHSTSTESFEATDIFQEINIVDRLVFNTADQTVAELRLIINQALLAPYGSVRLLLIKQADQLPEIMQNTLLKLLEEPPEQLMVVLEGNNKGHLLATVRSRLHQLPLNDRPKATTDLVPQLPDWLSSFKVAESRLKVLKNRVEATALFTELLTSYRDIVVTHPSPESAQKVDLILKTIRRLSQNINYKIIGDAFLLHWFDE